MLKVTGYKEWVNLKDMDLNKYTTVDIKDCGDIHPFRGGPVFENVETVFMRKCDKNFVFYWLNKHTFPKVKTIYLVSHPCEPEIFRRFPEGIMYIADRYSHYVHRWADERENIKMMSENTIHELAESTEDV